MRRMNNGFLALAVLGGIYIYRNRFKIQQFLERQGIDTPLDTSNVINSVRSGVSKVVGTVQNQVDTLTHDVNAADRKVG